MEGDRERERDFNLIFFESQIGMTREERNKRKQLFKPINYLNQNRLFQKQKKDQICTIHILRNQNYIYIYVK